MRECSRIVFIGQFPPPINGLTFITARLALALDQAGYNVAAVNTAVPGRRRSILFHGARLAKTVRAMASITANALSRKSRVCYFTAEGGFGLIYSVMIACCARAVGLRIFLHHHSFSYIIHRRTLMDALLACVGPEAVHIFLSSDMAEKLADRYGRTLRSLVLSNAAFVDADSSGERAPGREELVIGLLSNLTAEKGLYEFIAVLRLARQRGIPIRGILAGPMSRDTDKAAVEAAKEELGDRLDYQGPVYGDEKVRFFADIDVFVFLTTYLNEAQPAVIFEAMARGIPVVSCDRGCIRSQVADAGFVLRQEVDIVSEAVAVLEAYSDNPNKLASHREAALRHFSAERSRGQDLIANFFDERSSRSKPHHFSRRRSETNF